MSAATACPECGLLLGHLPRDPDQPHQLVNGPYWTVRGTLIYVSCNCRRLAGETYEPLEIRGLWLPGEMAAVWRRHMTEVAA